MYIIKLTFFCRTFLLLHLYLSASTATQARPMSCNQSDKSILVSDWLQLTGLGHGLRVKLISINVTLPFKADRSSDEPVGMY